MLGHLSFWAMVDLVFLGRSFSLDAGQWASWVQAVGSIAAILGAVWAAVHATSSANKSREEDAREAGVSQVMFARALLRQGANTISMIRGCAAAAQMEDLQHEVGELSSVLSTWKSLIAQSRDAELTRILVRGYEPMSLCHSQAKASKRRFTDLSFAEFTAGSALRELDSLRGEIAAVAARLRAPAEPAGAEADFDVLPNDGAPNPN